MTRVKRQATDRPDAACATEAASACSLGADDAMRLEVVSRLLDEAIATLPLRYQLILRLRYGLDTGEPMTAAQVGEAMGLTKNRVYQMEQKAVRGLRRGRLISDDEINAYRVELLGGQSKPFQTAEERLEAAAEQVRRLHSERRAKAEREAAERRAHPSHVEWERWFWAHVMAAEQRSNQGRTV